MTERRPPPVVSVVIPVRDMAATIGAQLAALARQDFAGPWEIVVADNGSRDASAAIAAQWQERLPLRVVDAAGRRDRGYAKNIGAAAARGDLLAFCDADDEVRPDWLRAMVGALQGSSLVAGVLDHARLNPPALAATVAEYSPTRPRWGFLPSATGANLGVRRAVFDELTGFPERHGRGEDTAFCWRAQLAGHQLWVERSAIVDYRLRRSPGDSFVKQLFEGASLVRHYKTFRCDGMPRPRSPLRDLVYDFASIPVHVAAGRWDRAARVAGWRLGRLFGSVRWRVFCP